MSCLLTTFQIEMRLSVQVTRMLWNLWKLWCESTNKCLYSRMAVKSSKFLLLRKKVLTCTRTTNKKNIIILRFKGCGPKFSCHPKYQKSSLERDFLTSFRFCGYLFYVLQMFPHSKNRLKIVFSKWSSILEIVKENVSFKVMTLIPFSQKKFKSSPDRDWV